jgi:hypothetical protein
MYFKKSLLLDGNCTAGSQFKECWQRQVVFLTAATLLNSWASPLKDDLAAIGSSAAAFSFLGKQAGFGSSRSLRCPDNQRANCKNYFMMYTVQEVGRPLLIRF